MEYHYCDNQNFEDFASGRVLYGGKGIPNFPVRLMNEMFGRALSYIDTQSLPSNSVSQTNPIASVQKEVILYDPCCGGGYMMTVLGFFHGDRIKRIYASDIDSNMLTYTSRNLSLLTKEGLQSREDELNEALKKFGKDSHREALGSIPHLRGMLVTDIDSRVFQQDCTNSIEIFDKENIDSKKYNELLPNLIMTDIPYGNLVQWVGADHPLDQMLEQLAGIAAPNTILVLGMDKTQKVDNPFWKRLEKNNIGKRKFEIYRLNNLI